MNNFFSYFTLSKYANNLKKLKMQINVSTFYLVFGVFLSTFSVFYILHRSYTESRVALDKREIQNILNSYQSNMLDKLSIIASSPIFIDYLRSGAITRNKLFPSFLNELSQIHTDTISGMTLVDNQNNTIYNYGAHSNQYIKLNLCYFDQTLDAKLGECSYHWILYFNIKTIYNSLFKFSNKLSVCKDCTPYTLFNNAQNNQLSISGKSNINVTLKYASAKEYYYFYFMIACISILILGFWSWLRLNHLFNNYIVDPINKLTTALKSDTPLNQENNIEEIQLLINEISAWRKKVLIAKGLEEKATLAKIAAQLAHDIRSPVATMRIILKSLTMIPDSHKTILDASVENMNRIADSFLDQYSNRDESGKNVSIEVTELSSLLKSLVDEKSLQHKDTKSLIQLDIPEFFSGFSAKINTTEFGRLISNLINNSIEAMNQPGVVKLTLGMFGQYIRLSITDTGKGIPAHLLNMVAQGGLSVGKQNGNGLGISHAKKMIEAWNGSFELQSVEGVGTTVSIMLPRVS